MAKKTVEEIAEAEEKAAESVEKAKLRAEEIIANSAADAKSAFDAVIAEANARAEQIMQKAKLDAEKALAAASDEAQKESLKLKAGYEEKSEDAQKAVIAVLSE